MDSPHIGNFQKLRLPVWIGKSDVEWTDGIFRPLLHRLERSGFVDWIQPTLVATVLLVEFLFPALFGCARARHGVGGRGRHPPYAPS